MHPGSQTTAQEVPLLHMLCLQITVKPLTYPALLHQPALLLHGCRRLLANGKTVLENRKKPQLSVDEKDGLLGGAG